MSNPSSHPLRKRIVLQFPIDAASLPNLSDHRVFVNAKRLSAIELGEVAALPDLELLELSRPESDLAPLAASASLRHLHLDDPAILDGLDRLQQVTSLTLYYLPRVHSLDPVGQLHRLRFLVISTPPGYDASRKCHRVRSLAPLANLSQLERLVLRGILPDDDGLRPLEGLRALRTLEVTHVYAFGVEDYARLAHALADASGHCLVPYFEADWTGRCPSCAGPRVALTAPAPRTARMLCPTCQRDRLNAHVERWNAALRALQ